MKRSTYLILLALVCVAFSAQAQFGLAGYYLSNQAENWAYVAGADNGSDEIPGSGWQASVDYWFRLENKRIEFLPTLAYSQSTAELYTPSSVQPAYSTLTTQASFFFHTNFYLFDFSGDCDCPTFSKEGPTLKKGFFVQVSPGVSYFGFDLADYPIDLKDAHVAPGIGLALGMDLGISDLITLTPILRATYYPSVTWEELKGNGEDVINLPVLDNTSALLQYQAGLRIGFRPDKKRRWY